jgi:hypothetical protein
MPRDRDKKNVKERSSSADFVKNVKRTNIKKVKGIPKVKINAG